MRHVSKALPFSCPLRASRLTCVEIRARRLCYEESAFPVSRMTPRNHVCAASVFIRGCVFQQLARSFPTYRPYIASKAGVEGLVHVLANEMRGRNITVNAVAPGPVGTELFLSGNSDEQITELTKLARWSDPRTSQGWSPF